VSSLKAEIVAVCSSCSEISTGSIVCLVHRFLSDRVLVTALVRVTDFLCLIRTDLLRHTAGPEAVSERIGLPVVQAREPACPRRCQRLVG